MLPQLAVSQLALPVTYPGADDAPEYAQRDVPPNGHAEFRIGAKE
jgi:hypothetical protein